MRQAVSSNVALRVISLATCANVLGYMDRVCIAFAAPRLQAEFGLSETEIGFIFGAFSLSYALLQTPWGILADKRGARHLVAGVIFFWSAFTGLTAVAWNFVSLLVVRLLFGISEAALSPAVASAFKRYVSEDRRSTAFGIFLSGGRVGGVLAPVLAAALVVRHGWRSIFLLLAATGIFVLPAWLIGYPSESRAAASDSEDKGQQRLSLSWSLAALVAVAAIYTMTWQFYATWFPTYLIQRYRFSLQKASGYTSLAFFSGLLANLLGGLVSDKAQKRLGQLAARRLIVMGGLIASAIFLSVGAAIANPDVGSCSIAVAAGAGDLALSTLWAASVDLGGVASGSAAGLMNCFANLAGFSAPVLIGWLLHKGGDWTEVLLVEAILNVGAAITWLFVRTAPDHAASRAVH